MRSRLAKAVAAGNLREIDRQAALFLHRLAGRQRPDELLLVTALVSKAVGDGHICLPLESVDGSVAFPPDAQYRFPDRQSLRDKLFSSGVVGNEEENYPLILDKADRLYFARHYRAEKLIAEDLLQRSQGILPIDPKEVSGQIGSLCLCKRGR